EYSPASSPFSRHPVTMTVFPAFLSVSVGLCRWAANVIPLHRLRLKSPIKRPFRIVDFIVSFRISHCLRMLRIRAAYEVPVHKSGPLKSYAREYDSAVRWKEGDEFGSLEIPQIRSCGRMCGSAYSSALQLSPCRLRSIRIRRILAH